ncbi:MAG: hypothetical protein AAGM04_09875 [Pseudomonadota bacterium]
MRDILGERDETVPEKPTRVAEPSRESQLPKRFYSAVEIAEAPVDEEGSEDPGGYIITLDGRPVHPWPINCKREKARLRRRFAYGMGRAG